MPPLTLEIYGTVIYPIGNPKEDAPGDSVKIDMDPSVDQPGSIPTFLQTGSDHPLYRLPQSISSGGIKIHLNKFARQTESPYKEAKKLRRQSLSHAIDEDHVLFEINKALVGSGYLLETYGPNDSYGKAEMNFTPGWISGGTWDVKYVYKTPEVSQECRLEMKLVEGGKENGVWTMTYPSQEAVAAELPQKEDSYGENGRRIEILSPLPKLPGWSDEKWRDLLTACWITKTWRDCTKSAWLGKSVRAGEASNLGRW